MSVCEIRSIKFVKNKLSVFAGFVVVLKVTCRRNKSQNLPYMSKLFDNSMWSFPPPPWFRSVRSKETVLFLTLWVCPSYRADSQSSVTGWRRVTTRMVSFYLIFCSVTFNFFFFSSSTAEQFYFILFSCIALSHLFTARLSSINRLGTEPRNDPNIDLPTLTSTCRSFEMQGTYTSTSSPVTCTSVYCRNDTSWQTAPTPLLPPCAFDVRPPLLRPKPAWSSLDFLWWHKSTWKKSNKRRVAASPKQFPRHLLRAQLLLYRCIFLGGGKGIIVAVCTFSGGYVMMDVML